MTQKTISGPTVSSISANGVSSQQSVATGVSATSIVAAYVLSGQVGVVPFNIFINGTNVQYNLHNRTSSAQSNVKPTVYVRYFG